MKSTLKQTLIFIAFLGIAFSSFAQEDQQNAAAVFIKKGDMLFAQKKFQEAIGEYDHALALEKSPLTYYKKGMSYMKLKDTNAAEAEFEKSLELDNSYRKSFSSLMKVHQITGDNDKAIATLDRMADVEKNLDRKFDLKINALKLLINNKQYKKAAAYAKQVLALKPNNLDALYYDAEVNNELGQYNVAKTSMTKAIASLETDDPRVTAKLYYELGFAYHKLKQYDKAKEAFKKANVGPFRGKVIKFKPDYFTNIANCHAMVYDYAEASKYLKTALEIDPNFTQAILLMGEIEENSVDKTKAYEYYVKSLTKDHSAQNTKTYIKVLEMSMVARNYEAAIKYADELLALDPNNKKASFIKSVALYESKQAMEGIAILAVLLADQILSPMEMVSYEFAIGLMYKSIEEYEKAKSSFTKSAKGPFAFASRHELEQIELKLAAEKDK